MITRCRIAVPASLLAGMFSTLLFVASAGAQTNYTCTAATGGSWTNTANWSSAGVPTTGGTVNGDLIVNCGSGTLNYTSAQGYTTFANAGNRGLYIGYSSVDPASGNLNISGGTLSTLGSKSADYLAVGENGSLTVSSNGVYVSNSAGMAMNSTGNLTAVLTVQDSALAVLSSLAAEQGSTGSSGSSTINLNGGTLALNGGLTVVGAAPTTFNFNGGTFAAGANITFPTATTFAANVGNGGALIYTGSATATTVTIGTPLNASGSGGLTESGSGTLVLTQSGNYTGATIINSGALKISNGSALGLTSTVNVTSGYSAMLSLSGAITANYPLSIAGGGNNNGALQTADTTNCTWAGPVTIASAGARVGTATSGTLTISGPVGGSVSSGNALLVRCAGTGAAVVLSNSANTYSGPIDVFNGTLALGASNAIPTNNQVDISTSSVGSTPIVDLRGFNQQVVALTSSAYSPYPGTLTNSAATQSIFTVANTGSTSFGGAITGNINFVLNGSSVETLSGTNTNTYSGGTTINSGVLVFAASNNLPSTGQITINSNGALEAIGAYPSVNAWLTSGKIVPNPTGAMLLTATSPDTDINLSSGTTNSLYLGAVGGATYGGTIEPGSNCYLFGGGGGTLTVNTPLTGNNGLTVGNGTASGVITVVLAASGNYSGPTNVNGASNGTTTALAIANSAALGNTSAVNVGYGSLISLSGGIIANYPLSLNSTAIDGALQTADASNCTWAGPVTLLSTTATTQDRVGTATSAGTLTISGPIGGSGLMYVRCGGAGGSVVLSNTANAYTGGTEVLVGTLKLGANNALPASGVLSIATNNASNAPTVDLNGFNQQIVNLSSTFTSATVPGTLTNSSATQSIFTLANTAPMTFGGNITGNLVFVLNGSSIATLSGTANNYSGGTQINSGALVFNTAGAVPAPLGSISINSGGALEAVGAYSTVNAWLAAGAISPASDGAIALTAANTDSVIDFSGNNGGGNYPSLSLGAIGAVTYGGTIYAGTNGYFLGGGGGTLTLNTSLTGGNNLTVGNGGGGNVVLAASNSYSGSTTLTAGTLTLANSAALPSGGTVTVAGNATLQASAAISGGTIANNMVINPSATATVNLSSYNATLNGVVSGNGALAVLASTTTATLNLGGTNTYSGGTTINGGEVFANTTSALGTGRVTVDAGGSLYLRSGGTFSNQALVLAGSGSTGANGALRNSTNNNTWNGPITLAASALITAANNTLTLSGSVDLNPSSGTQTLGFNSSNLVGFVISGPIVNSVGTGAITKNGTGPLVLSGANSYSGGTTVNAGVLEFANTAAQPPSGTTTVANGASLALGVGPTGYFNSASLDSLLANTFTNVSMSTSAGIGIDTTAATGGLFTYGTNITGPTSLTKLGTNTLELTGSNTYTGGTALDAGNLMVASASALGSGTLTLNGGNLIAGPSGGTIAGLVQAGNAAHTIAPGGGGLYTGVLTLNGGLAANMNTTFSFNLGAPVSGNSYNGDLIILGGSGLTGSGNITFVTDPTMSGDYRLFGGSYGSPTLSNFVLPSAPPGDTYTLSTTADSGYLDLVVTGSFNGAGIWVSSGGTTWNNNLSWQDSQGNNGVPGYGSTGSATFSGSSSVTAIALDVNPTLSALNFSKSAYTLSGGTITLVASSGTPTITVSDSTSQTIASTIAGTQGLLLNGPGELILTGTNNYTGMTTVESGTLVLNNNEAIADGASLIVGNPSLFASVIPASAPVAAESAPVPVPEPSTLALLAVGALAAARVRNRTLARKLER